MNPAKDSVIRRTLRTMSEMIFDRFVDSSSDEKTISEKEKKKIDRAALKYIEASSYVANTFDESFQYLMQVQMQAQAQQIAANQNQH
ncbi:hypothetical protein TVAG_260640 [Trichomonas vaginalis G3]|uniref:Uncharacterized protein n=1 Tax=Trichomonas vaginalis (strain ATCC PRA-98 / G3) TaxID=412133 RepID=A2EXI7_TRIV3|nr:mitochondrial import inner membrane translocase subunit Tim13 like domains domain-containing protein [Trichomonas vaginalis G3]EAY02604.1 hypothetical protein TVAG_260640 [Trichomonas vaginalis G3]KAI5553369.1 mitochondrial import inner membrane translocase subunit Tim13 like domains domain-containing protein [Trichomonas vaginalis G3]|eukprot:XP_001314827.1 hypothetical protein [Trichomonas vaginalis G3]